jgi:hypothetical protein
MVVLVNAKPVITNFDSFAKLGCSNAISENFSLFHSLSFEI